MAERQLVVSLFRALYRSARTVEATAPRCEMTRRNAADMVLRGTLAPEALRSQAAVVQRASIACAERGPRAAVRAAFDAGAGDAAVDAALMAVAAADRVAGAAARLAESGAPAAPGATDEETMGFRVARLAGATDDDVAAAEAALDARAAHLRAVLEEIHGDVGEATLFDVLCALDASLFGGSSHPLRPAAGKFDDPRSHRVDVAALGGDDRGALPITLAVVAVAVARRAGLQGVFPVGAEGRFLVGVRGRGVAAAPPPPRLADAAPAPGAPDVGAAYEGDFLAEYGAHGKELVTLSLEGGVLAGVKVSGDDHVPAGETSFACDAAASTRSTGRIRVAGPGFSNPTWRDVDAVAVSRDELVLESRTEPVSLVLRRAAPDPASAVFLDAFGGGRMLTRHQLLRRSRRDAADGDDAEDVAADEAADADPFPAASPLEIGRRMARNLHNAAHRRQDRLDAMIWSHAELDLRAPGTD